MLTCDDLPGDCCQNCHDTEGDWLDDLTEIDAAAGGIAARVCCAKIDAARKALGVPAPPRVETARRFR